METTKKLPFFVYGTLRPGEANHQLFAGIDIKVTDAQAKGYTMTTQGYFPYLHRDNTEKLAYGTLIEVAEADYEDALDRLDRLEGYRGSGATNHYDRVEVPVTTQDGHTVQAWVYLSANPAMTLQCELIPSGDWSDYSQASFKKGW